MFSIEEAKVSRQVATLNIPAGVSREFGKGAVECAIEEKAITEQAEAANGIRAVLSRAWNKLTGANAISAQAEESTR